MTRDGRSYTPARTHQAEQVIRRAYYRKYGTQAFPDHIPLKITCDFFLRIPTSISQEQKDDMEGTYALKTPDTDNLLKLVSDALNGAAYEDDRYIVSATATKKWSQYPRTEVTVSDITP